IGLTMLTLISMAIYGLAQALGDSRAHNALLFYAIAPMSYIDIAMAIVLSRMAIIIGFSILFITLSLFVLDLGHILSLKMFLLGIIALSLASMFCFGLALIITRYCQNNQTMMAIANIVNIYALMSSNVFVPLSALPNWSTAFITTSPFFHFNNMLLGAFSGVDLPYVFGIGSILCLLGLLLIWIASDRHLFIATGRAR
ncbi:ABC transporter permease, partial [Aeromonas salmonicida]